MKVHASKEELESLPDWAGAFVNAAWGLPDEQGQRAALLHFKGMREITGRFADHLREAIRNPDLCEHNISVMLTDEPTFVEATFIMDRPVKIAHGLMHAWNDRATLAHCEVCGNLMQPGKGRVARTCSDPCRVKLHRREEKKYERLLDSIVADGLSAVNAPATASATAAASAPSGPPSPTSARSSRRRREPR